MDIDQDGLPYSRGHDMKSLTEARNELLQAFESTSISQLARIRSGIKLFWLLADAFGLDDAAEMIIKTVRIFPRIIPHRIPQELRETILSEFVSRSSTICSIVLHAKRPAAEAFEVLECAKRFMADVNFCTHLNNPQLELDHPRLDDRYEALQVEISQSEDENPLNTESSGPQKRDPVVVNQDIERIEEKIRGLSGFERYRLFPDAKRLQNMIAGDAIIALNTSALGSDALILTEQGIKSIPLNNLKYDDALKQSAIIKSQMLLPANEEQKNEEMRSLLRWLWIAAVKPVLAELNFLQPVVDAKDIPYIWWFTSGILGRAPLHAAGMHDGTEMNCTMDYAVSSYIPSLRALDFSARMSNRDPNVPWNKRILLVSASKSTGENKSHSSRDEAMDIKRIVGWNMKPTILMDPHPAKVLAQIHRFRILHFACNAKSMSNNPSASSFSTNTLPKPLEAVRIAQLYLVNTQLAYISSCAFPDDSVGPVVDESINMASTIQQCGVPHAIGTLWQVQDEFASAMATEFYKNFLGEFDGDVPSHYGKIQESLHLSISNLRKMPRWKDNFLTWAAFIHVGDF
ncbi:hypothetical protein H072_6746 [Dactylellina haptotyla CBS 200.50]|uniref:CHAT domain-containing protein n=1 Tax=Dactylellina haptotyla (strain CBS 200.50) TaxID=1284197 RepID=S8AEG6_DACHA|nr:hypothetical protein H072_6746 [Dactylellina haptotyla CBS 200.50]